MSAPKRNTGAKGTQIRALVGRVPSRGGLFAFPPNIGKCRLKVMRFKKLGFPPRKVVPEGLRENSPAFQRRDGSSEVPSPEGTAEFGQSALLFQSSLRDLF